MNNEIESESVDFKENAENKFNLLDNFDNDGDDNEISLEKIKASVHNGDDDDAKTVSDVVSDIKYQKNALPEINLQEPFQPGSSPAHLLSRYMVPFA